jgi:hypothetical protein
VPENDFDLSPSSSAKVKNEWSYASNGHICFMACIGPKTFIFIRYINIYIYIYIYKDKAIPLQAWTGREGSRRLRLPDFKIIGT